MPALLSNVRASWWLTDFTIQPPWNSAFRFEISRVFSDHSSMNTNSVSSPTIDKPDVSSFVTDTIFDLFMRPKKIIAHEDFPELFAPHRQLASWLYVEAVHTESTGKIYSETPRALEPLERNLL